MESKSFLVSKTLGVNLFMASATELFPTMKPWVATHPQTAILAMALINIVMRHFTTSPLSYRSSKK